LNLRPATSIPGANSKNPLLDATSAGTRRFPNFIGQTARSKRQQELVRDFGPKDLEPHAAVGHIGDPTQLRWTAF
jgi:hypothetical protein